MSKTTFKKVAAKFIVSGPILPARKRTPLRISLKKEDRRLRVASRWVKKLTILLQPPLSDFRYSQIANQMLRELDACNKPKLEGKRG